VNYQKIIYLSKYNPLPKSYQSRQPSLILSSSFIKTNFMNNVFPKNLSASLARRLAEAADGFRNVTQIFFIAGYKSPHSLKNFQDLVSAQAYFSEKGLQENEYGIFGPFKTNDEVHSSNYLGAEDIKKVELTIHYKDGRKQKATLPGGIDSIFFNLSSFDKFVFPYYCHVHGAKYAEKMRQKLIAKYKKDAKDMPADNNYKKMLSMPTSHPGGTFFFGLNEEEQELT
jgi:hypothetical protein